MTQGGPGVDVAAQGSRHVLRRTIDGVEFEKQIEPWSARRAKKLQRIGSPAVVTVRPYDERDW